MGPSQTIPGVLWEMAAPGPDRPERYMKSEAFLAPVSGKLSPVICNCKMHLEEGVPSIRLHGGLAQDRG